MFFERPFSLPRYLLSTGIFKKARRSTKHLQQASIIRGDRELINIQHQEHHHQSKTINHAEMHLRLNPNLPLALSMMGKYLFLTLVYITLLSSPLFSFDTTPQEQPQHSLFSFC